MTSLRDALDRSRAGASKLTSSFFPRQPWSEAQLSEFIDDVGSITIATVGPSGAPHAAFVIVRVVGGQIHFTVTPGTILERNLRHHPRVGFTICDRSHSVLGQGRAEQAAEIGDEDDGVPAALRFGPPGWRGSIWRIDPTSLFAG